MALKPLTMLVLLAGASFGAGAASATTVCLKATHGSTNYDPDTSCPTSIEEESSSNAPMTRRRGSETLVLRLERLSLSSPPGALDFASGKATIKPEVSRITLTISIPATRSLTSFSTCRC